LTIFVDFVRSSVKGDVDQLAPAGYISPPEIKFGSKRLWPEWQVSKLMRQSKAGGIYPFR
jgi:hypothetical protein